jgi:hypothetical protein
MTTTVKGIYRNGRVELLTKPEGVNEAEVDVTFPDGAGSSEAARAQQVRRQAGLKWLREVGWDLGGAPYPTRDELHDRTR